MSYTLEKTILHTIDELIDELINKINGNNIAIIGGHFLLFYNKNKHQLCPLIKKDIVDQQHIELADNYAGDFPTLSFESSLSLYKRFKRNNIESKVVLLVNDHKFQDGIFQSNIQDSIKGKSGFLRKEFYNRNRIPTSYKDLLAKNKITLKEIIYKHNNSKRKKLDLLPKESIYYSEQKLRNRFDKHVKPKLLKKELIYQNVNDKYVDLFFNMPSMGCEISLTEEGTCGCSAEVIELIRNLRDKDFREIIFFVPHECSYPVDNGIMASLNIYEKKTKVITINGLGGMKQKSKEKSNFVISEHNFF